MGCAVSFSLCGIKMNEVRDLVSNLTVLPHRRSPKGQGGGRSRCSGIRTVWRCHAITQAS